MAETLHIISPDISCEHCQSTIEREIGNLPGINWVTVEIPAKRIDISFDPATVSEADILSRLDDEGYPSTEWSRD